MRKRTSQVNLDGFRKQKKTFRLKPLAAILASALILAACGDNTQEKMEEVSMYRNVDECVRYNPDAKSLCETTFAQANQEAIDTAPRFATREDCVAEFGEAGCQVAPVNQENATAQQSSGSFWMPLMAGFLFGKMMGGFNAHKPLYSPQNGPNKGSMFDSSGKNFGSAAPGTKFKVNPSDMKPGQPGQTMRRGGFGQMVSKQSMAAQSKSASSSNNQRATSPTRSMGG